MFEYLPETLSRTFLAGAALGSSILTPSGNFIPPEAQSSERIPTEQSVIELTPLCSRAWVLDLNLTYRLLPNSIFTDRLVVEDVITRQRVTLRNLERFNRPQTIRHIVSDVPADMSGNISLMYFIPGRHYNVRLFRDSVAEDFTETNLVYQTMMRRTCSSPLSGVAV